MGAAAGAFAAAATTPLDVVKTNMMVNAASRPSMMQAAASVLSSSGVSGFFRGERAGPPRSGSPAPSFAFPYANPAPDHSTPLHPSLSPVSTQPPSPFVVTRCPPRPRRPRPQGPLQRRQLGRLLLLLRGPFPRPPRRLGRENRRPGSQGSPRDPAPARPRRAGRSQGGQRGGLLRGRAHVAPARQHLGLAPLQGQGPPQRRRRPQLRLPSGAPRSPVPAPPPLLCSLLPRRAVPAPPSYPSGARRQRGRQSRRTGGGPVSKVGRRRGEEGRHGPGDGQREGREARGGTGCRASGLCSL